MCTINIYENSESLLLVFPISNVKTKTNLANKCMYFFKKKWNWKDSNQKQKKLIFLITKMRETAVFNN